MKQPRLGFVILLCLVLNACVNLPVHNAKWLGQPTDKKFSGYYNNKSKLVYDIYRDSSHVYLQISTSNITTQIKMLRLGFTVWIDPTGKKNQNKGFIYPNQEIAQNKEGNENQSNIKIAKDEHPQKQAAFSHKLFRDFRRSSSELVLIGFKSAGSRQTYRPELQETAVDISIKMDSMGTMLYEARLPIDTIFNFKNPSDSTFSIGLMSGALNFQDSEFQNNSEGGNRITQGGGVPQRGTGTGQAGSRGSVSGRRGTPGQVGNRPGGQANQQQNTLSQQKQALSNPVNIWFRVKL